MLILKQNLFYLYLNSNLYAINDYFFINAIYNKKKKIEMKLCL